MRPKSCIAFAFFYRKFVDETFEQCACISSELFPNQLSFPTGSASFPSFSTSFTPKCPVSSASRLSFRSTYDGAPILSSSLSSSHIPSPPFGSSPRSTSILATASHTSELARGVGHTTVPSTPPVSDSTPRSFEQPPATRSVANHSLIGATVFEHFIGGLVLQATTEQADVFGERLENQLNKWLQLGPLIIRGMNLSTRKIGPEDQNMYRAVSAHARGYGSQWYACGMLVNADMKTVQVSVRSCFIKLSITTSLCSFHQLRSIQVQRLGSIRVVVRAFITVITVLCLVYRIGIISARHVLWF